MAGLRMRRWLVRGVSAAVLLSVLLLLSCATEHSTSHKDNTENSALRCLGYCDLVITDKNAEITVKGRIAKDEDTDDSDSDTPDGVR